MLNQFITFKPDQVFVAHILFKGPVFNGFAQSVFKSPDKCLFPFIFKPDAIHFGIEIFGFDLFLIQNFKNYPVDQKGFEDFCQVEGQGKPPFTGRM